MKLSRSFFVANSSLLLFGVLFTFSSSFGQTFFWTENYIHFIVPFIIGLIALFLLRANGFGATVINAVLAEIYGTK